MSCFRKIGQIQHHIIILLCRLNSLCLEIENHKLEEQGIHFDNLKHSIFNSSERTIVSGGRVISSSSHHQNHFYNEPFGLERKMS